MGVAKRTFGDSDAMGPFRSDRAKEIAELDILERCFGIAGIDVVLRSRGCIGEE